VVKLKRTAVATSALIVACVALPCRAQSLDPNDGPIPGPPSAKASSTKPLSWDAPDGDGRRTLGAFPKNLGRSFVGVFSGQNVVPFAVGVAATTTASAFDTRTRTFLQGSCGACGTTGASMGGAAIVPVVGVIFAAGRFAPQGRFRAASYDFAQAAIVNGAYTSILKYSIHRTRPDGSNNLSFPSGHTSTAFSLATVANQHYGWKVGVPAYLLASGIGFSRIEKDKHYLSDVLAGAALGIIVGRTVTRLDGERPAKKSVFSVGPATDSHGQGLGVGFSASW
jgi:membrane-associated phospholipid phosphatase